MSRALLSFLGGMGSGYLSQTEKNKDRERQERLDAQSQQRHDALMKQTQLQIKASERADKTAESQALALDSMNQYMEGNEANDTIKQSFQDATGMSKDSTNLLASSAGGYGGGVTGLQAAASDRLREDQRFADAAKQNNAPPVDAQPAETPSADAPVAGTTPVATKPTVAAPAAPSLPMTSAAAVAPVAAAPATAAPSALSPAVATPATAATPATPAAGRPVFSSSIGGMASAAGAYTEKGLLERQKKYHLLGGNLEAANAAQEKIKTLDERDADVSAYKSITGKTNGELFEMVGKQFNQNTDLDGTLTLNPATGKLMLQPYDASKPPQEIPRSVMEQAAFTMHRIGRGDVAAGLEKFATFNKEQRELVGGAAKNKMAIAKAFGDQDETAAKVGYYNAVAGKNDALTANGGRAPSAARVDHFDARQWDAAGKIDKSVVSLFNDVSGKEVESGDLRSIYMRTFNNAKTAGTMAPNEAAEHATTTVVRLKAAAADRVAQSLAANPKSTLTVDGAIREILRDAAKVKPAPAANSQPPKTSGITNPGNMRPSGASTGFAKFDTPEAGMQALDGNLKAYGDKGFNTINKIIGRWAPPSENNTAAYASAVSRRLGINPDQALDMSNPIVRQALATAITLHEHGPSKVFSSASN